MLLFQGTPLKHGGDLFIYTGPQASPERTYTASPPKERTLSGTGSPRSLTVSPRSSPAKKRPSPRKESPSPPKLAGAPNASETGTPKRHGSPKPSGAPKPTAKLIGAPKQASSPLSSTPGHLKQDLWNTRGSYASSSGSISVDSVPGTPSLDPHQRLSVGLVLASSAGGPYAVTKIVPGSPAELANCFNIGNIILKVNGVFLAGKKQAKVNLLLRGLPGTVMTIEKRTPDQDGSDKVEVPLTVAPVTVAPAVKTESEIFGADAAGPTDMPQVAPPMDARPVDTEQNTVEVEPPPDPDAPLSNFKPTAAFIKAEYQRAQQHRSSCWGRPWRGCRPPSPEPEPDMRRMRPLGECELKDDSVAHQVVALTAQRYKEVRGRVANFVEDSKKLSAETVPVDDDVDLLP